MSADNLTTASQSNGTSAEPASAVVTEVRGSPAAKRVQTKTAVASAAPKPTKVASSKPKSTAAPPGAHSTYIEMVKVAISELKEKAGSSRAAILKHITQHNQVGNNGKVVNAHLRQALIRGVKTGVLKQTKGVGASGSFRVGEKNNSKAASTVAKPKVSPKEAKNSPAKKVAATKPATTTTTKPATTTTTKPATTTDTKTATTTNTKPKKTIAKKLAAAPKSPVKKVVSSKNDTGKVAAAVAKPKKAVTVAAKKSPPPSKKKKAATKLAAAGAKSGGIKTKTGSIIKKRATATAGSNKKNVSA